MQHDFVHLSFHQREFEAFLECLNESYKKIAGGSWWDCLRRVQERPN